MLNNLISNHADINAREKHGWTPLLNALSTNQFETKLIRFYNNVYGGDTSKTQWGTCYENSKRLMCMSLSEEVDNDDNPLATWNETLGQCVFSDEWYRISCENWIGGYYEDSVCYVKN